jgi:hypothetical protein
MRQFPLYFAICAVAAVALAADRADGDAIAACEEAIRQKRVALQAQYVGELVAMEKSFQANGALEDLLVATAERKRFMDTPLIAEANLVKAPEAMRELQQKYIDMQQNAATSVAEEFIARLEQQKKALTIEGKLDEAVKAKKDAEQIQKRYLVKVPERKRLVGKWEGYSGDAKVGACEVLQVGDGFVFVNEVGSRSRGLQKDKSTVIAVDWGGLAGTLSPDTTVIQWHNGTSWRR